MTYGFIAVVSIMMIVILLQAIYIHDAKKKSKNIGELIIDRSDPNEEPYFFLNVIGTTPNDISKCETVSMTVVNKNFVSQE